MCALFTAAHAVTAQGKRKPGVLPTPTPIPTAVASPTPSDPLPEKKNGRPVDTAANQKAAERNAALAGYTPVYFYKFERDGFTYSKILIEHDEKGKGKISFQKEDRDEIIEDPISLSTVTTERLTNAFAALSFLTSNETYQTPVDHSNLGNVTVKEKKDGKEREATFNWTTNPNAKLIMDEYRHIANEYTWKFEIAGARENQRLLTPGLMDAIDGYLSRNEISDPPTLVPFLSELSQDEKLPLIARNHAARLIKQIEKKK